MLNAITINLPDAMIQSMDENCKIQGITRQELIRIATAKMLFEENGPTTELHTVVLSDRSTQTNSESSTYEIPLDKIVSVQYTLNDGKIINIMREKKI